MRRRVRKDAGEVETVLRKSATFGLVLFQIPNRFEEILESCALLLQTVVVSID